MFDIIEAVFDSVKENFYGMNGMRIELSMTSKVSPAVAGRLRSGKLDG
jgi:hypothetical protein